MPRSKRCGGADTIRDVDATSLLPQARALSLPPRRRNTSCGGSRSTFGAQRRSAFGSLYRPTRRSRAGHTAAACVRTGCADEGKTALWSRARCCTSTRPRRCAAARDARAPAVEVSDWMCFVFDDYQQSIRKNSRLGDRSIPSNRAPQREIESAYGRVSDCASFNGAASEEAHSRQSPKHLQAPRSAVGSTQQWPR